MFLQMRRLLRPGHCAPLHRRRPPGRTLWTVPAAQQQQQRGGRAAGSDAPARSHKSLCRGYASDALYGRAFASARDSPDTFWAEAGQDVSWFQPWSKTLHVEDPVFPNW